MGGSQNGQEGLIGNLLPAASLDAWMKLVHTFACYPGLHMLHEIATQEGGPLIPARDERLGHRVPTRGTGGGTASGRGATAGAVSDSTG